MDFKVFRPAVACLSRKALRHNIKTIRGYCRERAYIHRPDTQIMAMIKADAYGHDVAKIMPELLNLGIRQFAVASIEEGIQARRISSAADILVLGGTLRLERKHVQLLIENRLDVSIHDLSTFEALENNSKIGVHLKLDTGMNRLGIKNDAWAETLRRTLNAKFQLKGLFTHYATAQDEAFYRQVMLFEEAVRWFLSKGLRPQWIHSENSAALFGKHSFKKGILSEVANLIRPGISMYGYYPRKVKPHGDLSPVLELMSEVGLMKSVDAAEGISYGHLYRAKKKHPFGIVTLGYADGLSKAYSEMIRPELRSASGKKKGQLKVCGAICMDMVMVRPALKEKIAAGDQVVFWGRFPNEILKGGLVEPYELNLRISKRIPRVWVA